jgi:hypothetical protein
MNLVAIFQFEIWIMVIVLLMSQFNSGRRADNTNRRYFRERAANGAP